MFLLLKPSDQPFHSPASFNVISIDGIHFAYISCCKVGQALASFADVENNLLLTEYALNLNTLWKSPISQNNWKFVRKRVHYTSNRILINAQPGGEVSGEEVVGCSIFVDLSVGLHRDDDPSDLSPCCEGWQTFQRLEQEPQVWT